MLTVGSSWWHLSGWGNAFLFLAFLKVLSGKDVGFCQMLFDLNLISCVVSVVAVF